MSEHSLDSSPVDEKTKKVTRLIIKKDKSGFATHMDSNAVFAIRQVDITRSSSNLGRSIYEFSDLSNTRSLQVLIREGYSHKEVGLPDGMLDRISLFLSKMNNYKGIWDCGDFMLAALGIESRPRQIGISSVDTSKFDVLPLNDENLKCGEAILIKNEDLKDGNEYRHYAISIGDGLFLSKFGTKGPLIACNIEEMKMGFNGKDVFVIHPNGK